MEVTPIIIAIIPGAEIRASFAYSFFNHLGILDGYLLPLVVSFSIIPIVYLTFDFVFALLTKFKIFNSWLGKVRQKTERYVDRYGFFGLALFVGIPFPGSGLYTGTVGAHLLGFEKRRAIPALFLGNLLSSGISLAVLKFLSAL